MDQQINELLLASRRTAYLITNSHLRITDSGGDEPLLKSIDSSTRVARTTHFARNAKIGRTTGSVVYQGRSLLKLFPELAKVEYKLKEVLSGTVSQIQSKYIVRSAAEETTQYMNIIVGPRLDRSGHIVGLTIIIEDASEAGGIREKHNQLYADLQLLQNQMDMIAHELGTPLTLISGYTEMLNMHDNDALNSDQKRFLELISHNVDHLLLVVNGFFDMVYAESGYSRLALQPVDLGVLVQRIADDFQPRIVQRGQCLTVHHEEDLPFVICDITRIVQIMNHLLSNASKFSPVGSEIDIVVAHAQSKRFLQVSITDSGTGILEEETQQIFQRFYRTEFGNRSGTNGAGLGLYVSRLLVELHGGKIWCESSQGMGSTFSFTLPVTTLPTAEVSQNQLMPPSSNRKPPRSFSSN